MHVRGIRPLQRRAPAPEWIRQKVIKQCERFAELSVWRAFLLNIIKDIVLCGGLAVYLLAVGLGVGDSRPQALHYEGQLKLIENGRYLRPCEKSSENSYGPWF